MIPDRQMYGIAAVVMAIVALTFALLVVRTATGRRRYSVATVVLPAVMLVAYFMAFQGVLELQGPDGDPVVIPRVLGYAVVFPTVMVYIGMAGGLSRRQVATLVGLILAVCAGVSVNWLAPAPLGAVGAVLMLVSLTATAYVLLVPYARIASERHGELNLLYGKLRNLVLLVWGMLVVGGLLSTQSLGVLDRFTGIFVATYLDLLTVLGFGLIVLRSGDAIDLLGDRGHPSQPADSEEAPEAIGSTD